MWVEEWSERGGRAKSARWCGVEFAVRSRWDLWIQISRDVREFYSRYCLSLTPSVCVIRASSVSVSSSSLFLSLSHTHTHSLYHTHIHSSPISTRGDLVLGRALAKKWQVFRKKVQKSKVYYSYYMLSYAAYVCHGINCTHPTMAGWIGWQTQHTLHCVAQF